MAVPSKLGFDENGLVSFLKLVNNTGTDLASGSSASDGLGTSTTILQVLATQMGWNGASFDRQRFSDGKVRRNTVAMAGVGGTLNIWTPAASKKFRLQYLTLASDVGGTFHIKDAASQIIATIVIPSTGGSHNLQFEINGYISLLANNILQVDYPAVTGNLYVTVTGNEE